MQPQFQRALLAAFIASSLGLPNLALATNGTFSHGYGTQSKGMAGAGVALSQDALSSANNPASMVNVGNRMDFGASIFSPKRKYEASDNLFPAPAFGVGEGENDSSRNYFLIPHFGYNKMMGNSSSFGVSVYGNGGMNTKYQGNPLANLFGQAEVPGVYGAGKTGVDLTQLFVNLSYAKKLNPNLSLGGSLILAMQAFEADGLDNFGGFTESVNRGGVPENLSGNGHDFAYGAGLKVGMLAQLTPQFSFGASVQSKIYMGEFDDYADLFAEAGDFDVPATATIGVAFKPTKNVTAAFDIQWIGFSDVDAFGNPLANLFNCPSAVFLFSGGQVQGGNPENCLGGNEGGGFGWDDVVVYKFGVEWQTNKEWTWRVGYSHTNQPINAEDITVNIVAPAVVEDHFTFGFTRDMGKSALSFAAMYAPEETVSGPNAFANGFQTVDLSMRQYELELSWAMKLD